jgi:hypothetical protein
MMLRKTAKCRQPAASPKSIGLTPKRIGFITENGQGLFENVKVWTMSLEEE